MEAIPMCDCYAGSVIISASRPDNFAPVAISDIFGSYETQTLEDAAGRSLEGLYLKHYYWQVNVPPGSEQSLSDAFRRRYIEVMLDHGYAAADLRAALLDTEFAPIAQPEAQATPSATPSPATSSSFTFTPEHNSYRQLINMVSPASGSVFMPTVGVIDTGWKLPSNIAPIIISEADLTQKPVGVTAPDSYGHGSVVLAIINDLAPTSQFRIYRIGDKNPREWTFLAGLACAADDQCDIVNASVGFGMKDRNCATCGRDYGTTRSQVFHRFLVNILDAKDRLIYVGSAGNQSSSEPIYPARFRPTVCVASTDGNGTLSTFSNWGNVDQDNNQHPCVILAPGGDRQEGATGSDEYVANYVNKDWRGTSFSAAYVSGLLADYLSQNGSQTRANLVAQLNNAASVGKVSAYSQAKHGVGLAQRI
jgi:hypothetical protein